MIKRILFDEKECKWYTQYNGNRDYSPHNMKLEKLQKAEERRKHPEQVRLLKQLMKGGHKNRQSLIRELPSVLVCDNDFDRQQSLQSLYDTARHSLENDPSIDQQKIATVLDKVDKMWCALEWAKFEDKPKTKKRSAMKSWIDSLDI